MTTTQAPLRGYQRDIGLAAGIADPARIGQIEELMRAEFRTLDHLTAGQFARAARRARDELTAYEQAAVPRQVNDLVGCSRRPGRTYQIIKVNDQSYLLADVSTGARVRASKSLVTDPPPGAAVTAPIPAPIPAPRRMVIGSVARWNGPKAAAGVQPGGLCVILRDNGEVIRAAKLGGHDDRYIDRARRDWFTPVNAATILAEGADPS